MQERIPAADDNCMEVYLRDLAEQGGAVASKLDSTERLGAPVASPVRAPFHKAGGVAATDSCVHPSLHVCACRHSCGLCSLILLDAVP